MTFANPLPWWALGLIVIAAAGIAWQAYRSFAAPPAVRYTLVALRFVTLLALVLILMRPVARSTQSEASTAIVPVLVDGSRSMGIEDVEGGRRIDHARRLLTERLLPALRDRFSVELLSFGESVAPAGVEALSATARLTDLDGALAAVAERYRGRPVAGIVLLSDGGDTVTSNPDAGPSTPVFPIGIGSTSVQNDREVLSVTVAERVLDDSRVDLAVSAVSHGRGTEAFDIRLLENGRPVDVRRVAPAADGSPVHEVFHASPPRDSAVIYTVEIPSAAGELVPENNARSVLVQPPARRRRILLVEGAPGYEHAFLKRAWSSDQGLEVDAVVRKGTNEQGRDTFYIQASQSRAASLRNGYPTRAEDLFQYDAIVLANLPGHHLARAQLQATRDFVARRGGGLLVLGAQSFHQQGFIDTPIDEVLPLDLSDRGGGVVPASNVNGLNRVGLTPDGEEHPVMRLGTAGDTRKRWEAVPALASVSPLGGPRAGATVLAITTGPGGAPRAVIAVQRFGEGRSMLFTGEGAWRWRMLLPAGDRSYQTFWRQAVRWLALPVADPIAITTPAAAPVGERLPIRVAVRDDAFEPVRDAEVTVRVTAPDGRVEEFRAAADPDSPGAGRYVAYFQPEGRGIYRVTADVRRDAAALDAATASLLVGGADPEMADPRLNEAVLGRLASASGGAVSSADDLDSLADALQAGADAASFTVRRDLWHNGWSLAAIVALLSAEWVLRRRKGLR